MSAVTRSARTEVMVTSQVMWRTLPPLFLITIITTIIRITNDYLQYYYSNIINANNKDNNNTSNNNKKK